MENVGPGPVIKVPGDKTEGECTDYSSREPEVPVKFGEETRGRSGFELRPKVRHTDVQLVRHPVRKKTVENIRGVVFKGTILDLLALRFEIDQRHFKIQSA